MSAQTEAVGRPSGRRAGLRGWIERLARDRRGVAAVEFALVVPLLLCMYFVTMEVSQAIETDKKVSRIASMVADLIAQQQNISSTEVQAVMQIGEALLQPYHRSRPTITITAIEITDETTPKVQVAWSAKLVNGAPATGPAKGSPTTVPAALNVRASFLIRVESTLPYKPVISWAAGGDKKPLGLAAALGNFNMTETYYLRPRMSSQVVCTGC